MQKNYTYLLEKCCKLSTEKVLFSSLFDNIAVVCTHYTFDKYSIIITFTKNITFLCKKGAIIDNLL